MIQYVEDPVLLQDHTVSQNAPPNDELFRITQPTLGPIHSSQYVVPSTTEFFSDDSLHEQNANDENSDNSSGGRKTNNSVKSRKRQEGKKQCESRRRNKFKEQLEMLQSLLLGQVPLNRTKPHKLTREIVVGSAINEIVQLREELSQLQQLVSTIAYTHQRQQALKDPLNRDPYSTQDLERAFESMFTRTAVQHFRGGNHSHQLLTGIKSLEDVSKQLAKAQHKLSVAMLEQLFHMAFCLNPKELSTSLPRNWNSYQDMKKTQQGECVGLFLDIEFGPWILSDMSLLAYMTGDLESSDRYYQHAKDLAKKLRHPGTNHFLLGQLSWNTRSALSISTAKHIWAALSGSVGWELVGAVMLGSTMIAHGQISEGIDIIEYAMFQYFESANMSTEISQFYYFPITTVLEAYIQARQVDKGLAMATDILNNLDVLEAETIFGKAEMMRQKANLLIMKQYPDFVPEMHKVMKEDPSAVQDMLSTCQIPLKPLKTVTNPAPPPQHQQHNVVSEDIEALLCSAINSAHVRGLYTIELRCAIDMVRYFLHIGSIKQAVDTVLIVKDCVSRMKGSEDAIELQKARYIISLVEACLQ